MQKHLAQLKSRLAEIFDLRMATSLLTWDQTTYMPPGGAEARGRQIGLLSGLAHQRLTDPEIGRLLDQLEPEVAKLPYDSDEAGLVRATRREFFQATRVPAELVSETSLHAARSYQAWTAARPANDFAAMRPHLEKTLELSRRTAECFPGSEHIADPLIDFSDFGMKASTVKAIFDELRARLVPIVREVTAQPLTDDSCLRRNVPLDRQLEFGLEVIRQFGYDFERGRQDLTHHPFMTKFSLGDVRITTRGRVDDLSDALFSTLHEAGHAMYEQGIDRSYEGTPLANGTSSGVHESQSRLWENLVGRSRPFWNHFYPKLQQRFGGLDTVTVDSFYRAINKVERSLIRVDADELTYNLHVMIRFDLELRLLEGKLAIKDLPEAWRARYESDLGIAARDDRNGVLQDVHWYAGLIGGQFQGYTIGNILSAQFFEAAVTARPTIPDEIGRGEFAGLHTWLREHVYRPGAKFTADEVVRRVTGGPMSVDPYIRYLTEKYRTLYDLRPEKARVLKSPERR